MKCLTGLVLSQFFEGFERLAYASRITFIPMNSVPGCALWTLGLALGYGKRGVENC